MPTINRDSSIQCCNKYHIAMITSLLDPRSVAITKQTLIKKK